MTNAVIIDQLYSWRQALEGIDLCAEDSRQRLNELYTEIVNLLRQELRAATFTAAAPSLDQKGAAEAANPDTKIERLWELASHHPGEVVSNPIWSLLLLGDKGLIGKDDYIDERQLFPFAQVEGFWLEVHRRHKEDWHGKLLLSYTALLPREKHPFRGHPLIKALYDAIDVLSAADLKNLELQTDELGSYGKGMLQPVQESLNSLNNPGFTLPGKLEASIANDVLLALGPVFAEGDELLDLVFRRNSWGSDKGVFLDASPIADLLLAMPKTKLVDSGVSIYDNTLYPAEVYERLARHRNSGPQSEVAACIHTPTEVFEQLAHSTSKEIIYPLACNPMTPISVLHQLMNWSGWGAKTVQSYVQANPAYTGGEVWQLMEMGRLQLQTDQRKKDVLLACLQLLSSHPDPLDGVRLLLNASIWDCWRLEPSTFRLQMIQKGWASEELMLAAAWSWHWLERLAVAKSPLAPAMALTKLQSDGLGFIRYAASQPRRSMAEAASAASPSSWIGQLAAIAADDPVACVRHPRFADWLDQEPDRVASLLSMHHKTILAADDLPTEYFCWHLSQLSEREQLRLLMHRHVPKQALDQLVRYDAGHEKLICQVPEKRQGDLADLVASTAASHLQQSNPELLRCAKAELEQGDWEHLSPQECAFFIMGFYTPCDVKLLNTDDMLQLLLHPYASNELRVHLCQELDKRGDELARLGNHYLPGCVLRKACHPYVFIYSQEHELNYLKSAGQLLGIEGISERLRRQFTLLVGDLAADIFSSSSKSEWLEVHTKTWPAVLCARDTGKLVSSRNPKKRLVGVCFGDLSEAQTEALARDSSDEIRYALALLRPCTPTVLGKLSTDPNFLVNKAALQNVNCPSSTLEVAKGRSPLRNPNLAEQTARNLLNGPARKEYLKHAGEILCWTPALMQEVLDSLDKKELESFVSDIRHGYWSSLSSFAERPYSPGLLGWMALLPVQSRDTLNRLRELAASHPATPAFVLEQLINNSSGDLGYFIASNPTCSTDLHRAMRKIGITGNPIDVVSSPNYPVDWLTSHASDQDPDVRATVTLHPNCPLDLLIRLLSDNAKTSKYGPFKHRTVAEVASTSPAIATFKDPVSHETAALALLRSTKPSSRARRLALRSPNCPLKMLSRCASSLDWRERHAVASHPQTPTRLLKGLMLDANQHVAQAATKHGNEEKSFPKRS
jgi:hypothetical protein